MIVDNLKIPFVTSALGVDVTVERIGPGEVNSIHVVPDRTCFCVTAQFAGAVEAGVG